MNFKNLYNQIKLQRHSILADIDRYGLISIPKYDTETYKFLLLIHLMLSSQTKDIYTHTAITRFQNQNILNCSQLSNIPTNNIIDLIHNVGFANKKAEYLILFANTYRNKKLPETYEETIMIKGVGNKMAYLYLQYLGIVCGIGVDTHVFRVCKRLGLNVKTPDECDQKLQTIFDKSEWAKINYTLVGFGQEICKAKRPKCEECIVKHQCPSSRITTSNW